MDKKVRTLHVDTERTWRGGEQQAVNLAKGLVKRGQPAEVVGQPGSPFVKRAREANLITHEISMRGEVNPLALARLRGLVRQGQFDIVHAHTSHAHTLSSLASARLATRCVVSRRVDFKARRNALSRLKYRRGVDRYIAISNAVRDVLIGDGVNPELIEVVPSGVDPDRLKDIDPSALRDEFNLKPDQPVIGAVAHFAWHKGLDNLIRAVPLLTPQFPNIRVFLVGDGELASELKVLAEQLADRQTIVFPGFRSDAPSFLKLFDVVVTPSVMEGLNTTNLDALLLERPVVASSVGGIPEAIIDGETGVLVPPEDPEALAEGIRSLLEDREGAKRMGQTGKELALKRFTTDAMVEGTLAAYRRLLSQKDGGA